jgi:protein involved in polysaccharide export with SLBB domain
MRRTFQCILWLSMLGAGGLLWVGCAPESIVVAKKFDPRAQTPAPVGAPATNLTSVISSNQIRPEWLLPSTEPYRLGPGDRIELELLGRTGTRTTTFVCADGKIYFDLLPGMDVWALTLEEARAKLEKELTQYYQRPRLSLQLTRAESKRVWVMGRLNKSGVFPLDGPMTVIEAIARAGGLFTSRFSGTTEELADLNHSFLVRNGEMLPINFQRLLRQGDTTQNIYLEPDDFLYLPSSLSSQIYVLGAVRGPRPLGYVDRMTLTTAIAKALGTTPDAYVTQVAIVRGSLSEPRIGLVNFQAIYLGRQKDVSLQAGDIIFVPRSPFRSLERYAKLITDTFVRTVAANEGGHAVDSSFGGVGVSNPLGQ